MPDSRHWQWKRKFWRIEVGFHCWQHVYSMPSSPDRWVIKPHVIYDRKRRVEAPDA